MSLALSLVLMQNRPPLEGVFYHIKSYEVNLTCYLRIIVIQLLDTHAEIWSALKLAVQLLHLIGGAAPPHT